MQNKEIRWNQQPKINDDIEESIMNRKAAIVGVLAIATLNMASLFISPVMGLIVAAFSNEPLSNVQLILSVANLTGLIAAFVIGKLAMTVPNKTIALGGIAFILVFGLIPYFVHANIWILVACSGMLGIGMGALSNILPALMADYFPEDQRQSVMGMQVAFASIGLMVMGLIAGKLGTISWNSAYLVYAYAAIVLIVVAAVMPKVEKTANGETQDGQNAGNWRQVISPAVITLSVCGMMFLLINNAYNTNYALVIDQKGLGGSDVSGMISTIGQFGGLIAGLCVGAIAKKGRNYMLVLTFAAAALGMLCCAYAPGIAAQAVGSFIVNASMSFFYASAPFMMTVIVKPIFIPLGMAVLTVFNSVGGFISPYVINGINTLFGSTAVGAVTVGAVLSLVMMVALLLSGFQKRSYAKAHQH
nr:MFS transporter [Bifidobacterium felsineum]